MPRIETRTLYQYDELPTEKAKAKAREWLRELEAETFDADYTLEDATRMATVLGITIDNRGIAYRGFSSQGDGASFTGRWVQDLKASAAIRAEAPRDTELHRIADALCSVNIYPHRELAEITRRSYHYAHEMTVDIEVTRNSNEDEDIDIRPEDVRCVDEALRSFMRWIYRQLELAWDRSLSDASLIENLTDNDYEFLEDGTHV